MTIQPATVQSPSGDPIVPTGCCPPFDPTGFQDREITWTDKLFLKERVHSFFHIPIDMAPKMKKVSRKIAAAHAGPPQNLMLSDEASPWRSDLFIEVTQAVQGAQMATLSGHFFTHVYEGPYRDAPKWYADMQARLRATGRTAKKIYFGYTTCPACAKAYGKNYVVLFAELVQTGVA